MCTWFISSARGKLVKRDRKTERERRERGRGLLVRKQRAQDCERVPLVKPPQATTSSLNRPPYISARHVSLRSRLCACGLARGRSGGCRTSGFGDALHVDFFVVLRFLDAVNFGWRGGYVEDGGARR